MNDKLDIYEIQKFINTIIDHMELFRKCKLEQVTYSELIKLYKQAIYILEQMSANIK